MKGSSFEGKVAIVSLAAVAVIAAAYLGVLRSSPEITHADATDGTLVALGQTVYKAQGASCHGGELQGQPNWRSRLPDGRLPAPPHDESGHTWHHPDQQLFDTTKFGGAKNAPPGFVNGMPGFGQQLSGREIWAALAYIKSRWPAPVQRRQAMINDRVSGQR